MSGSNLICCSPWNRGIHTAAIIDFRIALQSNTSLFSFNPSPPHEKASYRSTMPETQPPKCRSLVLDAGPLLSLSPLRGLAEKYITTPQVLAELRDPRAREHFEKLGLMSGVKIEVRSPTPASLTQGVLSSSRCKRRGLTEDGRPVIQWSKKTGDYSVLSHPDLCVLALTHTLHEEAKRLKEQATSKEAESGEASIFIPR